MNAQVQYTEYKYLKDIFDILDILYDYKLDSKSSINLEISVHKNNFNNLTHALISHFLLVEEKSPEHLHFFL